MFTFSNAGKKIQLLSKIFFIVEVFATAVCFIAAQIIYYAFITKTGNFDIFKAILFVLISLLAALVSAVIFWFFNLLICGLGKLTEKAEAELEEREYCVMSYGEQENASAEPRSDCEING